MRALPPLIAEIPPSARLAARVLLFGPTGNVLLLRASLATQPDFWVCPGGGLEPGETWAQAATRVVCEETGLSIALGQEIWFRRHTFEDEERHYDLYERFFTGRCDSEELMPIQQDSYIVGSRWWPVEELVQSPAVFAPRRLPELVAPIARGEVLGVPFDCGV
jgi:ADP-ribose pyrophosphatase YjhB (NUDIX family)